MPCAENGSGMLGLALSISEYVWGECFHIRRFSNSSDEPVHNIHLGIVPIRHAFGVCSCGMGSDEDLCSILYRSSRPSSMSGC
jgi:hypothetical protein